MTARFDLLSVAGLKKKPPRVDPKYATFNRRMMAATLDSLVILLFLGPLIGMVLNNLYGTLPYQQMEIWMRMQAAGEPQEAARIFKEMFVDTGAFARWAMDSFWQCVGYLVFAGLCWKRWSATPGKMLFRIRIVDVVTEQPISRRQIWLRLIGYVVSSVPLFLGFFSIGWDKQRRGWHDKIAGTAVIVIPWREKIIPGSATVGPSGSQAPSTTE